MEQIFSGFAGFIWSLAGSAVLALAGYIAFKAKRFFAEHAANNRVAAEHGTLKQDVADTKEDIQTVSRGIRMVLKAHMVDEHKRLVHQHYATPEEKDHFAEMHEAYSALGGNGTGDALYADVMAMHSIAPNK